MGDNRNGFVNQIYDKYENDYNGDLIGRAVLIASEIKQTIGGKAVVGFICDKELKKTPHVWVECAGEDIDPIFSNEYSGAVKIIVHKDQETFEMVVNFYKPWRVK